MNRLFLILCFAILQVACGNISFNSEKWKENNEEQFWMLNDLVKSKILIGKSKEEIINLLDTTEVKKFDFSNNNWMYIIAKPKETPSIQNPIEVLDVKFENGKVIKAEIRD